MPVVIAFRLLCVILCRTFDFRWAYVLCVDTISMNIALISALFSLSAVFVLRASKACSQDVAYYLRFWDARLLGSAVLKSRLDASETFEVSLEDMKKICIGSAEAHTSEVRG